MIPYTLIVASASRPHLLLQTLTTLLANIDQLPDRIIVHDDAVFSGKRDAVFKVFNESVRQVLPDAPSGWLRNYIQFDDPPILHGPTLAWLLGRVETEYVLYSQDDHEVIRPLPIAETLAVMEGHNLHHVRFNKRDTGPFKETWQGRWYKVPMQFALCCREACPTPTWGECGALVCERKAHTLTVADHWYFQTSLWRVAQIKPVVDWFMDDLHEGAWFGEHAEAKINNAMNGNVLRFPAGLIQLPSDSLTAEQRERDASIRAQYQRTFIFGGIDCKAFIRHIGGKPDDWALPHPREVYDGRG